jgi:hypothetical protein
MSDLLPIGTRARNIMPQYWEDGSLNEAYGELGTIVGHPDFCFPYEVKHDKPNLLPAYLKTGLYYADELEAVDE